MGGNMRHVQFITEKEFLEKVLRKEAIEINVHEIYVKLTKWKKKGLVGRFVWDRGLGGFVKVLELKMDRKNWEEWYDIDNEMILRAKAMLKKYKTV